MMPSGDESDAETMSTDMLEDISDGSNSNPRMNRKGDCYRILDHLKQRQVEWK